MLVCVFFPHLVWTGAISERESGGILFHHLSINSSTLKNIAGKVTGFTQIKDELLPSPFNMGEKKSSSWI